MMLYIAGLTFGYLMWNRHRECHRRQRLLGHRGENRTPEKPLKYTTTVRVSGMKAKGQCFQVMGLPKTIKHFTLVKLKGLTEKLKLAKLGVIVSGVSGTLQGSLRSMSDSVYDFEFDPPAQITANTKMFVVVTEIVKDDYLLSVDVLGKSAC